MVTGTQLGDLLFRTVSDQHTLFVALFTMTALLGTAYLGIIGYLTRRDGLPRPHAGPPAHRVMFRYWPQPVVLVALLMGVGFTVTTVFLTRYATEHRLGGIGTFFAGYAVSAFVFRWVSRTWSQTIGRHRMLLIGLAAHTAGYLLLTRVTSQWDFVLPSLCSGFGHALLFPCVVSLGAGAFPPEHRGTGTSLTLASIDLGTMISAPMLGGVIERHGFDAMFYWAAGLMLAGVVIYGALKFRARDNDSVAAEEDGGVVRRVESSPELATADVE
jgi:MFS family permease